MEFLHLVVCACMRLQFLHVVTNHGPQCPVPAVCIILCSNVQGLARNLSDLTEAMFQYDILLCSETLVSDMRHVLELLVPGFGHRHVVPRKDASGLSDGCIHKIWLWNILPTQI